MRKLTGKRGQVTVFLIIGIVILAIFAGVFYTVSKVTKEKLVVEQDTPLSLEVRPRIRIYVESCLQEIGVPGIYLLGMQGGLIYPEDLTKVMLTENAMINYGYLDKEKQLSLEKMEEDLGRYIEETLEFCVGEFEVFEEESIFVSVEGEMEASSKILKNEVIFNLKYPLEVTLGEDSFDTEDFSARVPVRLGELVSQAGAIIGKHEENPNIVDLEYLTSFDTFVTTFPYDAETFVYSIYDEESVKDGAALTFMFAIKDAGVNEAPELDYVSDFVLGRGLEFEYVVTATDGDNDKLTFSSDSEVIPIDSETGLIKVTPTVVGTYYVTIKVEDGQGGADEDEVRFVIE